VEDTTVFGIHRASGSGANARRKFFSRSAPYTNEDDLLARVLITSWSMATGRTLREGVAPHSLTEDELISFWADDHLTGRAAPAPAAAAR
jgi:hypothetical protein